jgi:hypothetical protein
MVIVFPQVIRALAAGCIGPASELTKPVGFSDPAQISNL